MVATVSGQPRPPGGPSGAGPHPAGPPRPRRAIATVSGQPWSPGGPA